MAAYGPQQPNPKSQINRLKRDIKKIEKQKEEMFHRLGKETYQHHLDNDLSEPALNETSNSIREMDTAIGQMQIQIDQLKMVVEGRQYAFERLEKKCPFCGYGLPEDAVFCQSCGKNVAEAQVELQQPAPGSEADTAKCTKCGAEISPGARFCRECGAVQEPVAKPAKEPAGVKAPTGHSGSPKPPPPPAAPAGKSPAPPPPPAASKARKCSKCGAEMEEADAAFCTECGAKL